MKEDSVKYYDKLYIKCPKSPLYWVWFLPPSNSSHPIAEYILISSGIGGGISIAVIYYFKKVRKGESKLNNKEHPMK